MFQSAPGLVGARHAALFIVVGKLYLALPVVRTSGVEGPRTVETLASADILGL